MSARSRERALASLVAVVVVAASVALGSTGAAAREQAEITVSEGHPASGSYPGIIGVQGEHGPAKPGQCSAGAGCDLIPLTIVASGARPDADAMLTVTVTWEADDGNVLNAALFSEVDDPSPDPARNEEAGLVKWTTGDRDGSLVLRTANPVSGRYRLTISSTTGENRGYDLVAELAVHQSTSGGAAPSPFVVGNAPGASTASGAAPTGDGGGQLDPGAASGHPTRSPDARFDGAVGVSTDSPTSARVPPVALALVVLALALIVAVSTGTWRASRAAAARPWFRDIRLFWKLMAPFVAVIVIVGVVGTFLTTRYLADRAETELARRLSQASASAAGYLRDQEFTLLDASRYAANVQGLPESLSGSDASAAERALASVAAINEQLDVIAAVMPDGRSLATLTRTGGAVAAHAGERWEDAPPVQAALAGVVDRAGDKHAGFVRLQDGTTVMLVAAPVRTDRVVGAVVVGRRTGPITAEAAQRSDASVALYDGGSARIATSDGLSPERLSTNVATGEGRRERETAGGREVGRLITPIELRDRRAGSLMVSAPVGSAFDTVRGTAIRLGLLVAVGLAAIVAIGALLSRSILRTVQPLLATNRALGRGELSARAPVYGNDELGELAEGVNQMAEQLEASHQQLERRVAERTEELRHLYRTREEFFASVSHELRTPLFAILANSEMLTDPDLVPDDPAERAEFVDTIHTSAGQLVRSVNDILDLAKAEAAAVSLAVTDLDPGAVLGEVAATLQALGRSADIAVALDSPRRLPPMRADRDRLVQILLNLGSNAIKYTPSGGRVTITARSSAGALEVVVADTGLGIPADVGERIFEPYYVVERSSRPGQPSTGLGLAITKRLVQAHGGTIGFTSEPGAGTTFTVRIPLQPLAAGV